MIEIFRLSCGSQQGSAFFVTPCIAITARHSVVEYLVGETDTIELVSKNRVIIVKEVEPFFPSDIDLALLKIENEVPPDTVISLAVSYLPRDLQWEAVGYPLSSGEAVMTVGGVVGSYSPDSDRTWDTELIIDSGTSNRLADYSGFSGAPVFVGGRCRAIVQEQFSGSLRAVSLQRIRRYLHDAQIPFEGYETRRGGPEHLQDILPYTVPNSQLFARLELSLQGEEGRYIVVQGASGSGKSVASATFEPISENIEIVGRYFIGGASRTRAETQHLPAVFSNWLSQEACFICDGAVAAELDDPLAVAADKIGKNLEMLSRHFGESNKLAVIIVDNVDFPKHYAEASFLQFLPSKLPASVAMVFTANVPESLASNFPDLVLSETIDVPPLSLDESEVTLALLSEGELSVSASTEIAQSSRGNPLLLTFLYREFCNAGEVSENSTGTPVDLSQYYEARWKVLAQKPAEVWLLATVCNARGELRQDELSESLPDDQRLGFSENLRRISHFLSRRGESFAPYHTSLRDFVLSKTAHLKDSIHKQLASFCAQKESAVYSVTNRIFHLLESNTSTEEYNGCATQDWLDRGAVLGAAPDLLLADLDEVLRRNLKAGNLIEGLRVLLLRSRMRFRYNNLFIHSAANLAMAAVYLQDADAARALVTRQGSLACSIEELLDLARAFVRFGEMHSAELLFSLVRPRLWKIYEQKGATHDQLSMHLQMVSLLSPMAPDGPTNEMRRLTKMLRSTDEEAQAPTWGDVRGQLLWMTGHALKIPEGFYSDKTCLVTDLCCALLKARYLEDKHGVWESEYVDVALVRQDVWSRQQMVEQLVNALEDVELERLGRIATPLAEILINESADPVVVQKLTSLRAPKAPYSLRAENGVDLDARRFTKLYHDSKFAGFCGENPLYYSASKETRHEWEEIFLEAISWLGFARGRHRAGLVSQDELVNEIRAEFFSVVGFQLTDRARWEQAYQLPEIAAPRVWLHFADLVSDLDAGPLRQLIGDVLALMGDQLGTYTEGFRHSLFQMASVFIRKSSCREVGVWLFQLLYDHVSETVFERSERISILLAASRDLGSVGETSLAEKHFKEAVRSSVGPDWYKEDQFSLYLDCLETLPEIRYEEVVRGVTFLELASGDTTFQRYVRQQKERLIGLVAERGSLSLALALLRSYLIPTYELQRDRLLRPCNDRVGKLGAARFGAGEVEFQAAISSFLGGLKTAHPLRQWALVEACAVCDDRYLSSLGSVLENLLDSDWSGVIEERFLRMLRVDVPQDRRFNLAERLGGSDTPRVNKLLVRARELGVLPPPRSEPFGVTGVPREPRSADPETTEAQTDADLDSLYLPGVFGKTSASEAMQKSVDTAKERFEQRDRVAGTRLVIKGLSEGQSGGWGIWVGHPCVDEGLELLFRNTDIKQALTALGPLVMAEEYVEDWRIAIAVASAAMNVLEPKNKIEILNLFMEHLLIILAPESSYLELGAELKGLEESSNEELEADRAAEECLLTTLESPGLYQAFRVADTIFWLVGHGLFSEERLARYARESTIGFGRELAAGVLHSVGYRATDCEKGSPKEPNSLVRHALGYSHVALENVEPEFPINASYEWPNQITAFFERSTLRVATASLEKIEKGSSPQELSELWEYRRRAFGARDAGLGTPFEREAVFRAVPDPTEGTTLERPIDFSLWNPHWPDARLSHEVYDFGDAIVTRIQERKTDDLLKFGSRILMHHYEFQRDSRGRLVREIEIYGFEVLDPEFLRHRPESHLEIEPLHPELSERLQAPAPRYTAPLITIYPHWMSTAGGGLTPSKPNARLLDLYPDAPMSRLVWRDGRLLQGCEVGPVCKAGCALLVEMPSFEKKIEMGWMVRTNGQHRVVFRGRVVDLGGAR